MIAGLNSSESKVLSCVPKQIAWPDNKIIAELERQGIQLPVDKVRACLRDLVEMGLIKVCNREYINPRTDKPAPLKPLPMDKVVPMLARKADETPALAPAKPLTLPKAPMAQTPAPVATEIKTDFLGALASKAQVLRLRASKLQNEAEHLLSEADQLDELGIKFAEFEQQVDQKLERYNQLQALLKGIQG